MKSLYELDEMPPTGIVPKQMYASVIRRERYGRSDGAFRTEVVDVPPIGRNEVLVYMITAGINYNNVWAASGKPLDVIGHRQRKGEPEDFHIGGSEGAGIVWAVGDGIRHLKVGDHVITTPAAWDETALDIRSGADPASSSSAKAWGYETNYGSFAQFTPVKEYQCIPKPTGLGWAESAAFLITGATAYRQLIGWHPNVVRPGDPVLIWGGSGGLGCMAIQIARLHGGLPVAVVSDTSRADFCKALGAQGIINRRDFTHWGRMPDIADDEGINQWLAQARAFGARFWEELGDRRAPTVVLEHTGQDTIPTSMYICDSAGMVVICGGTSGYNGDIDLRFLWMRQKRLQGSHFATTRQCLEVTRLIADGSLDPCLSRVGEFEEIGSLHQLMSDNKHPPGNMAVRISDVAGIG